MNAVTEMHALAASVWDALVIGAGPAGSLAARQLATCGLKTLLVEAKTFPRAKVCGGCLNRRGIAALERVGLGQLVDTRHSNRIHALHWIVGHQRARLTLPEMRVVDRAEFDHALVQAAMRAGVTFLDGVQACVERKATAGSRTVTLARQREHAQIEARVVIAADGLGRSSLKRLPDFGSVTADHSRIGAGAMFSHTGLLTRDEITMVVGRQGYVGLAALGGDKLNVAAALDPAAVARKSVGEVIFDLLHSAGFDTDTVWSTVAWHGTPPLTSRPGRVAAERVLVVGDASGYVEPFSGEGMATALETALAVTPLAEQAADRWSPELAASWTAVQRRLVVDSQATCRQLAWILRHGWAAAAAVGLCRMQPWVARRFIRKIS
jgi:flavin-dependent dehydrogenase